MMEIRPEFPVILTIGDVPAPELIAKNSSHEVFGSRKTAHAAVSWLARLRKAAEANGTASRDSS